MSHPIQSVTFTAHQQAELLELVNEPTAPAPAEIAGRTLVTLISPGTELNGAYLGQEFPRSPGYAAIFQVEQVGTEVKGVQPGELRFCTGRHRSYQRAVVAETVAVPAGLSPEWAVFTRLMGVTMSTLTTTTARPPALMMVTGLGPVGHLGAQTFQACGYQVIAVDPDEQRQAFARQAGIGRVYPAVPVDDPTVARQVALHLECSGYEQATLDGCKVVQPRGEIALVGAPWSRRSEIDAHEVLRLVFFNYLTLRSGWEWELPLHATPFRMNSIFDNYAAGLRWLQEGRVKVEGLYALVAPKDAQQVYQDILHRRIQCLVPMFDWRN